METNWDTELAALLEELSAVQDDLLAFLVEKRELLSTGDLAGLAGTRQREQELGNRLENCQARRGELLAQAASLGLPSDSLRSLSTSLSAPLARDERKQLDASIRQAAARSRLLQHHSLTNWVLTQRTLLHLSQLLEIIGTGGRPSPTYGKSEPHASGALVDRAA